MLMWLLYELRADNHLKDKAPVTWCLVCTTTLSTPGDECPVELMPRSELHMDSSNDNMYTY